MVIYLVDESGIRLRDFLDPNGGRFDAAGGFDRLLTDAHPDLKLLSTFEPYSDSILQSAHMPELLADLDRMAEYARGEDEQRGLNRLRALAERCADDPSLSLLFVGD